MPTLTTMTIKDHTGVCWFGALCPQNPYIVDDVNTLISLGKTIGVVDDALARRCWSKILNLPDSNDGVNIALKDLLFHFNALAAPGYSFRPVDTAHGILYGWWPTNL